LSGGTGGTGGVASGAAGTSGTAATSGIAATNGTAGTGTAGSPGDAAAGGSPYEGVTAWGSVTVEVGPTNLAAGYLYLTVDDPPGANPPRTFTYPSTTRFSPNDGAYIMVRYTCGGPAAVDQLALYSCAADGIAGGTGTPGCIGLTFDQRGPMGNFLDTDGTSCGVVSGTASFHVPPPGFSAPPTDASTPDAASGSFLLDCIRPDATHLSLMARFVIPFDTRVLLCIN
jgi:hypothetical protein